MCEAEHNGICYAWACYSPEECGARDNNGNPKYASNKEMKEFYNQALDSDHESNGILE